MPSSDIVAIIPAGGKATNSILRHTTLPDTMLPINGKPVIGYILDNLITRSITNAVLVLNSLDTVTEKYVSKKFGQKLNISFVYNESHERGVGYAIYTALPRIQRNHKILIYLGDTIYQGPLSFESDFLVTTNEYQTSDKWCFVEKNARNGLTYINKPKEYRGDGQVLAGLYFLRDGSSFVSVVEKVEKKESKIELYHILAEYGPRFTFVPAEKYYDCGNIENYYRAKIDFIKTRSFNTIIYDDLYSTVTKTGQKQKKLEDEINWYKNTPEQLKVFSPRLIDYRISDTNVEYSLEYYGYQTLADYFVFNHFDERVWRLIIDRLFEITSLFTHHTSTLPYSFYDEMYRHKTEERLNSLRTDPFWEQLLNQELITINGTGYLGWPHFSKQLSLFTKKIFDTSPMTFIHGDLCLSNILFDPHNRIFKLIDPRGSFGTTSVYGDHHYDIAKLRHSFVGYYDFIVSDLFIIEGSPRNFSFKTFHESDHDNISEFFDLALKEHGYSIDIIKIIEALLFLSMIPLHNDAPQRQRAMFLTGIMLLNSLEL